ncbi:MAG: aminotransferase class V-fold PLP-dependent enzyme, partial [Bacteroidota bacterium]|nr:aminotransferase class V-fold PLP-dependent enzyme [Bacteroidota bacterium]
YVCMLTLQWLKQQGGIDAMEKINNAKADLLYNAIDNSSIFIPTTAKEDRSKMNACFVMNNQDLEKKFLEFSKENNIYGIKGHRSVGGFRASMYNALPLSSVEYLVEVMKEFERRN